MKRYFSWSFMFSQLSHTIIKMIINGEVVAIHNNANNSAEFFFFKIITDKNAFATYHLQEA